MIVGGLCRWTTPSCWRNTTALWWDVCPIALVRSCPGRQRWGIGTCSAGQMRTRLPF